MALPKLSTGVYRTGLRMLHGRMNEGQPRKRLPFDSSSTSKPKDEHHECI